MKEFDGIFVLGPTASGKSDLAMQLARALHGELVCIDSRTVYRGMDIGTAKPTAQDRATIPHHLLDVTIPSERMSVQVFQKAAWQAVEEIKRRDCIPIFVGGATIFSSAVLYSLDVSSSAFAHYEQLTVLELQEQLTKRAIPLPLNEANRIDLISYLVAYGEVERRLPHLRMLQIGTRRPMETMKDRIQLRTTLMFQEGLEKEVQQLVDVYGWCDILASTIGYQEFRPYFEGKASKHDVWQGIVDNTLRMARYQEKWFGRDDTITWAQSFDEAMELCRRSFGLSV